MRRVTRLGAAAAAIVAGAIGVTAAGVSAHPNDHQGQTIKHVLLISVDGLHQSDLKWYVANHPNSELAKLANGGLEFSNAHTVVPSDSDPGGTALMTGGDPRATGVYYDVEYNHSTYEAGTTNCTGPTGGDVIFDSPDDYDVTQLDGVPANSPQAIPGLDKNPALIMNMTPAPQSILNPATFPVDAKSCQPITPWDYLKVNTIFQVIHNAGLRTAWSDKHAIYTSFNGPGSGGKSIDDFFAPEIDSNAIEPDGTPYPGGISWTGDNAATRQYDGYKVQAIVNEINGFDHSGRNKVGTPAIFGMNFQVISTAQKLLNSEAVIGGPVLNGGYSSPGVPGPLLSSALNWLDVQLKTFVDAIQANPQTRGSTAIVLTAKHGQSPLNSGQIKRIDDGPIINAINAAWTAAHPGSGKLIVAGTDDDLWQSYLSVKTQAAADFVKNYLWSHTAQAVNYANTGTTKTVTVQHSGLRQIYAGDQSARYFGVPVSDPRHPDVFGVAQVGTIYTTGTKIAEHGGSNPGDRDVPILVYAPGTVRSGSSDEWVKTSQVAPTVLALLHLNPHALRAVQIEGTRVLPGIGEH